MIEEGLTEQFRDAFTFKKHAYLKQHGSGE